MQKQSLGFGGGCHWCTESVFKVLKGVLHVSQGWISSDKPYREYSEAVITKFDPSIISEQTLVEIHLRTHSCTSKHALRSKYRSAVYYEKSIFDKKTIENLESIVKQVQLVFEEDIITMVLPINSFKLNTEKYIDYYSKNQGNQFCQRYIDPKLDLLRKDYQKFLN